MRNDLCADIGWKSVNKYGESLCGDHVDVVEQGENSVVVVLADGLGSGVKACILSTLTAKIISTMMAEGMDIEACISTIASTLPVCAVRGVAYSTFSILHIIEQREAEIIEFDNPAVLLLRGGKRVEFEKTAMDIDGKTIYQARFPLQKDDLLFAMSDGAPHAGVGDQWNFGWDTPEIAAFLETIADVGLSAKTLATILVEECNKLYGYKPGDDTTVCAVKIRQRQPVNLMIGPPSDPADVPRMMTQFFSEEGRHIVCGGTTSTLAGAFLNKPVVPDLLYHDPDIPPTARIEGVDLVTEGVITINRVLSYVQDYLNDNQRYAEWSYKKDGASRIARMLLEDATDVKFFVGRAVNAAHQNPDLPIHFSIKMRLVDELAEGLKNMGKRIEVTYF